MAENLPIMIANTNDLPVTTDSTYGFFRRLLILNFGVTIADEKQDKQLHLKMVPEYPGIFNWILEGRRRFIEAGYKFTEAKKVSEKAKDYEIESNSILGYLRENKYSPKRAYIGHTPTIMPVKSIYQAYTSFCVTMGLKPFSFNKLGTKLKEKGFVCGRRASVEYGIYELPGVDEYRKMYARGIGEYTMEEYSILLYGQTGEVGSVVEEMVGKEAKEPIKDVFMGVDMTDFTEGVDKEPEYFDLGDECP